MQIVHCAACAKPPRVARMTRPVLALCAVLLAGIAHAETFHGTLLPVPAKGTLDTATGFGTLTAKKWVVTLNPSSNGIAPQLEPVYVFFGDVDRLAVPVGGFRALRNGRLFKYRKPDETRGVRAMDLKAQRDGRWLVKLQIVGVDLSTLLLNPTVCQSLAIVVGDDDAFEGLALERLGGRDGTRVKAAGTCAASDWPWL
jgi:hypothetical protein